MGKNIGKNLNSKYSQELVDHVKQSTADAIKAASKTAIQKTAEATCDLISNKIADKIIKVSRTSPQNNSKTVTNEAENLDWIEKYLKKDIYFQKSGTKLLMI